MTRGCPDDDLPGALLLSRLPGAPISGNVTPSLANHMGEVLARIHAHTFPHFGDVEDAGSRHAHDWWGLARERVNLWKPHCARALPSALYAEALDLFDLLAAALPAPDGPVWTHNDFRPGNILVQSGMITGLIDFESTRGGSADYDFTKISLRVWGQAPETRRPFLVGYASIRPSRTSIAHCLYTSSSTPWAASLGASAAPIPMIRSTWRTCR